MVLNSAERAPFLLLVEVLHDDLDFDPEKKSNKDVLRNIVTKENGKRGLSDSVPLPSAPFTPAEARPSQDFDVSVQPELQSEPQSGVSVVPPTPALADPPEPDSDEEIDLVEQLYGNDQPLSKMIDISDSIVLPPTPKNKELDMATWSRSSPIPQSASSYLSSPNVRPSSSRFPAERSNSHSPDPTTPEFGEQDSSPKALSLDEYSERMRTAAIMLAQLNAGLARDDLTTASPRPDGQADTSSMSFLSRVTLPCSNECHRLGKNEALAFQRTGTISGYSK